MNPAAHARPLVFFLLLFAGGCASSNPQHGAAESRESAAAPPPRPYLLHLPGIGGKRNIDHMLTEGLVQGGINAEVEIYDWTGEAPGLSALYARQRNAREAAVVAEMITQRYRADPRTKIYLSGHSAGTAIALWALERLPDEVRVESLLLLASALSPSYDLSPALRHVRGRAYALHSAYDPVLGVGTRMFGTIDGIKTDAAGRVGFTAPDHPADAAQYAKLTQINYDPAWIRLSHIGDHIGPMMRPFAREVLGPLLRTGVLRTLVGAATRPATPPTTNPTTSTTMSVR